MVRVEVPVEVARAVDQAPNAYRAIVISLSSLDDAYGLGADSARRTGLDCRYVNGRKEEVKHEVEKGIEYHLEGM